MSVETSARRPPGALRLVPRRSGADDLDLLLVERVYNASICAGSRSSSSRARATRLRRARRWHVRVRGAPCAPRRPHRRPASRAGRRRRWCCAPGSPPFRRVAGIRSSPTSPLRQRYTGLHRRPPCASVSRYLRASARAAMPLRPRSHVRAGAGPLAGLARTRGAADRGGTAPWPCSGSALRGPQTRERVRRDAPCRSADRGRDLRLDVARRPRAPPARTLSADRGGPEPLERGRRSGASRHALLRATLGAGRAGRWGRARRPRSAAARS